MKKSDPSHSLSHAGYRRLFDQDGLPYTSRLRWGLLLFWVAAVFIFLAPLVGIYLGVWLVSKGKSSLPLFSYIGLTAVFAAAILAPAPVQGTLSGIEAVLDGLTLLFWLVSAFALRRAVIRYYSEREGVQFSLNPALTAVFGSWYVGGQLRADFPMNTSGRVGSGLMKLVV